jgi:hypothetical protein
LRLLIIKCQLVAFLVKQHLAQCAMLMAETRMGLRVLVHESVSKPTRALRTAVPDHHLPVGEPTVGDWSALKLSSAPHMHSPLRFLTTTCQLVMPQFLVAEALLNSLQSSVCQPSARTARCSS